MKEPSAGCVTAAKGASPAASRWRQPIWRTSPYCPSDERRLSRSWCGKGGCRCQAQPITLRCQGQGQCHPVYRPQSQTRHGLETAPDCCQSARFRCPKGRRSALHADQVVDDQNSCLSSQYPCLPSADAREVKASQSLWCLQRHLQSASAVRPGVFHQARTGQARATPQKTPELGPLVTDHWCSRASVGLRRGSIVRPMLLLRRQAFSILKETRVQTDLLASSRSGRHQEQ